MSLPKPANETAKGQQSIKNDSKAKPQLHTSSELNELCLLNSSDAMGNIDVGDGGEGESLD